MSFLVRQIALKASGDEIVRAKRVDGDEMKIGRDSSCGVHLADLAVDLEHALVTQLDESHVEIESINGQPFDVDGQPLMRKELGRHHAPRFEGPREAAWASAIGATIGFYDGFFGPGTGSFFVFLFVRALGYDFLHASASAKLLNTVTNAAALVLFAWKGHVWWHLALVIAVANILGSLAGIRLALKHGAGFVRAVFIVVVGALILKTGYDGFFRSVP